MPATATKFLPFHQALIEDDDIQAVVDVLKSRWLTTGARAREFETKFASYVGASNAVALSSCTAALHLALAAIGLAEGDEVIIPTMTFASTGEVVRYFGARPVLVDCEADSFQVDPAQIERAISPRTRAIIVVHYSGAPADIDRILDIARRNNIKVIEDAAHSFPTKYKNKLIGTFSDITCFSFYATKTMTTGEGGMVTTENAEYANRIRTLSLHGISKDAYKRYTAEGTWRYEILEIGYKYNLTDMQAALGISQLAKCEAMRQCREAIANRYINAFSEMRAFAAPVVPPDIQHAWHLFVIRVNPEALRISRDQVILELKERGIGTSVHFIPLHLHPYYQQQEGYQTGQFPNAESHFDRAISLPLFPAMTEEDCDRVIDALREIETTFRN